MSCILKRNFCFLSLLLICIITASCATKSPIILQEKKEQRPVKQKKTEIVITAVGDIMMPASIQKAVANNKYDYGMLFEKIAPDLSASGITFANLETPVDHKAEVSGYPNFNARTELLVALKKAGVGIVSLANNHGLDTGSWGLKRTMANLKSAGILFTGAGNTPAEARQVTRVSVRNITLAFLAFTYGTNGGPPRKKNSPRVNVLGNNSEGDLAQAISDVRKVRKTADLVLVSLHWGNEYKTTPTAWQRRVAGELIEAGADVILGHHPHVLQPIESFTAKNGRQGLIAFSLGNFISSQSYGIANKNRTHKNARRGDGIILSIVAAKEGGKTSVLRAEFQPIWTLRDQVNKTVVHRPVNLYKEIARLEALKKRSKEEENTLKLLTFRKQVIIDQLMGKTVP